MLCTHKCTCVRVNGYFSSRAFELNAFEMMCRLVACYLHRNAHGRSCNLAPSANLYFQQLLISLLNSWHYNVHDVPRILWNLFILLSVNFTSEIINFYLTVLKKFIVIFNSVCFTWWWQGVVGTFVCCVINSVCLKINNNTKLGSVNSSKRLWCETFSYKLDLNLACALYIFNLTICRIEESGQDM